jgi:DNA-binding NarL/FixJ family response regulator
LHPLLRTFLESKTRERADEMAADADCLARHLGDRSLWDDAFTVVSKFFNESLFVNLLENNLRSLLRDGRIPALVNWLDIGRLRHVDAPAMDLAEAELAFHEAKRRKAESLALRAARRLPPGNAMRSRAFYVAGISARMDFRNDRAKGFFDQALRMATNTNDERDAIWGELATSLDLGLPEARAFYNRLLELDDGSADSAIRMTIAQFLLVIRKGLPVYECGTTFDASNHLLPLLTEPHTVSSFKACRSSLLVLQGLYRRALAEITNCEIYARDVGLPFVIGYAKRSRAMAELGLRHFGRCKQLLDALDRDAFQCEDIFLQLESRLARARLLLAERQPQQAWLILNDRPSRFPYEGERAEWLATAALVTACSAEGHAVGLADEAEAMSTTAEVRALVPLARAIHAVRTNAEESTETAVAAFETVIELGTIDPFVIAYRGCPELLLAIGREERFREELSPIIDNAQDWSLARASELPLPDKRRLQGSALSAREREVLGLIAQGLTNREIGDALFVSASTAKVHVSHILEKLGVRSRTEAALRAAEFAEDN